MVACIFLLRPISFESSLDQCSAILNRLLGSQENNRRREIDELEAISHYPPLWTKSYKAKKTWLLGVCAIITPKEPRKNPLHTVPGGTRCWDESQSLPSGSLVLFWDLFRERLDTLIEILKSEIRFIFHAGGNSSNQFIGTGFNNPWADDSGHVILNDVIMFYLCVSPHSNK